MTRGRLDWDREIVTSDRASLELILRSDQDEMVLQPDYIVMVIETMGQIIEVTIKDILDNWYSGAKW